MNSYNPKVNSREEAPYYISATKEDITEMLASINCSKLSDLYAHIPKEYFFSQLKENPTLNKNDIIELNKKIANKNHCQTSFILDGLNSIKLPKISELLLGLRELTTSYTPYQPERSQGTLITLWLYQCVMSQITGFEAINSSFYERSTAIFEAIRCADRLYKGKKKHFIISELLFPNDIEVIKTHIQELDYTIHWVQSDEKLGTTKFQELNKILEKCNGEVAGIVFPQINSLGLLEDVDEFTNIAHKFNAQAITIIDPLFLTNNGLKKPIEFGNNGADMFVGDAQHLACPNNFGGPGLGIFGIRHNTEKQNNIRSTAGRYIGKAKDFYNNDCFALILSTREQHIKREKANSNICSNQAYIASICAAVILNLGSRGLDQIVENLLEKKKNWVSQLLSSTNQITLYFPESSFINEFIIQTKTPVEKLLAKAQEQGFSLGLNVSNRIKNGKNLLKISFSNIHTQEDFDKLIFFFTQEKNEQKEFFLAIPNNFKTQLTTSIKQFSEKELWQYYQNLCKQNITPDNTIYPLGSCTMKYNPYLNDYIASFTNFTQLHPQESISNTQGTLEILYNIQEYFKDITGLNAVTTQPVAGAQGEFVGIKLFQAYHRDKKENRDIILIPESAHGTNPATAQVAGFYSQKFREDKGGIIFIKSNPDNGEINLQQVQELIKKYPTRVSSIMITNPNTSGLFERNFKEISDLVHSIDAFVYMDGANMNAIAGWIDLNKIGVDAVHNNLHKTWSIPHGGGGPGDGIVAVSKKLIDYLPGYQIIKNRNKFDIKKPTKSIGSIHRHWGNFGHKIRCHTYLQALGTKGIIQMSAVAVLSARYLYNKLSKKYKILPQTNEKISCMHEFIIALPDELIKNIEAIGIKKSTIIGRVGKLFLDFGFYAPTVSFPEPMGLMIEPTESYTKQELDEFIDACLLIFDCIEKTPKILHTVPHFTPVRMIDELSANKNPILSEIITELPPIHKGKLSHLSIKELTINQRKEKILQEHKKLILKEKA